MQQRRGIERTLKCIIGCLICARHAFEATPIAVEAIQFSRLRATIELPRTASPGSSGTSWKYGVDNTRSRSSVTLLQLLTQRARYVSACWTELVLRTNVGRSLKTSGMKCTFFPCRELFRCEQAQSTLCFFDSQQDESAVLDVAVRPPWGLRLGAASTPVESSKSAWRAHDCHGRASD